MTFMSRWKKIVNPRKPLPCRVKHAYRCRAGDPLTVWALIQLEPRRKMSVPREEQWYYVLSEI